MLFTSVQFVGLRHYKAVTWLSKEKAERVILCLDQRFTLQGSFITRTKTPISLAEPETHTPHCWPPSAKPPSWSTLLCRWHYRAVRKPLHLSGLFSGSTFFTEKLFKQYVKSRSSWRVLECENQGNGLGFSPPLLWGCSIQASLLNDKCICWAIMHSSCASHCRPSWINTKTKQWLLSSSKLTLLSFMSFQSFTTKIIMDRYFCCCGLSLAVLVQRWSMAKP